jgi:CBS domain-containing protein
LVDRGGETVKEDLAQILEEKGNQVHTIESSASVLEGVKRMVDANVGSLLVTDGGRPTGIVTERDYLRRVVVQGRTEPDMTVGEIMSSPLVVATPETTIDECMALMTDRRIRHVPVAVDTEVVGVVSIGDLVKFKSKLQRFELNYLNDYITAR